MTLDDRAVERRCDFLEPGERGQTIDVGLFEHDLCAGCIELGDRRGATRFLGFAFLIGHDAFGRFSPAIVRRLGEISLGLFDRDLGDAGVQLRLRGQKLGVEFRRIDRRERLPCRHMIANIDKPFGDISVHAGVNGGLVPRGRLARKRKGLSWRRRTYRNDIDARLLRHVMVRRIG